MLVAWVLASVMELLGLSFIVMGARKDMPPAGPLPSPSPSCPPIVRWEDCRWMMLPAVLFWILSVLPFVAVIEPVPLSGPRLAVEAEILMAPSFSTTEKNGPGAR